ncbi:hypothetical protein ACP275_10G119400 [Erythranthe tilingii]
MESSKMLALFLISMLSVSASASRIIEKDCAPKTPSVKPPSTIPKLPVPPVTIPKLPLPPVSIPKLPLPPVAVPKLPLPPVAVPKLPLPPVAVPKLPLPPVTLPNLPLPPVAIPKLPLPPVGIPPVLDPPTTGTACPPPPGKAESCPIDTLKLGACVDLLGGLVHIGLGDPAVNECCPIISGLVEAEAAVCLCTTLKIKALNLKLYVPIALQLLVTCGKSPPPGYECSI